MHLLDDLIDECEILFESTEFHASVCFELIAQILCEDVHPLIGQPNLVEEPKGAEWVGVRHRVKFVSLRY